MQGGRDGRLTWRCRLWLPLLLTGLWCAFVVPQCTPWVVMSPDTGRYLALGRSLALGEGYRLDGWFCRFYPPGFPWLLSLVYQPVRTGYGLEKWLVASAALGALLASWALLAQRASGLRLALLSLLVVLSPTFVRFAAAVRSDMPFFLLSSLFLLCITRYWRAERPDWRLAAGSGAALALAAMTRSVALAFYAAGFLWLARPGLWRRDRPRCLYFAVALVLASVPAALWQVSVYRHRETGTSSYAGFLRTYVLDGTPILSARGLQRLVARQAETAPLQLSGAAQMLVRSRTDNDAVWIVFLLLPVLLIGLVRRLRHAELPDICFCAYGLLVTFWPYAQGTRFWLPMLPLVLGYLADGVDVIRSRLPRVARVAAITGAALLLFPAAKGSIMLVRDRRELGGNAIRNVVLEPQRRRLVAFLDGLDAAATVVYAQHVEIAPALGRADQRAIDLPSGATGEDVVRALQKRRVTHLTFDKHSRSSQVLAGRAEALEEFVVERPERFRLVHDGGGIRVYAMQPAP